MISGKTGKLNFHFLTTVIEFKFQLCTDVPKDNFFVKIIMFKEPLLRYSCLLGLFYFYGFTVRGVYQSNLIANCHPPQPLQCREASKGKRPPEGVKGRPLSPMSVLLALVSNEENKSPIDTVERGPLISCYAIA